MANTSNELLMEFQGLMALAAQRGLLSNSFIADRVSLAGVLGKQFGGDRDVYQEAGYPTDVSFEEYLAIYRREGLGTRIVNAPAIATWRELPRVRDGKAESGTEFLNAWQELVTVDNQDILDQKPLWHYLERVDRISGIGRYGVLLLGIGDGRTLEAPLVKWDGKKARPRLLYVAPYHEEAARVKSLDTNERSPRFGLPQTYEIDVGTQVDAGQGREGGSSGRRASGAVTRTVHWSRVIHVAEELISDEIYGTPRLEKVFNRMKDFEKVLAGSAEAFWRLVYQGIIFSADKDFDPPDKEVTEEKIEAFIHKLRRWIVLQGIEAQPMPGQMVDPSGLTEVLFTYVAAATGIPKRILMGSEMGQLASSQDERNWARVIAARQKNFAEPVILRPLIARLVYAGVLPAPATGVAIEWPSLFELTTIEQADVNKTRAEILEMLAPEGGVELAITLEEARQLAMLPAKMEGASLLDLLRQEDLGPEGEE